MNIIDFATNNATNLLTSWKMLNQLQADMHKGSIPENILMTAFERIEKTYDRAVLEFIDYVINVYNLHASVDVISQRALDNYHNNGTEPQFVLYAINDVYQYIVKQANLTNAFPSGM
jgi:hypothetical protein